MAPSGRNVLDTCGIVVSRTVDINFLQAGHFDVIIEAVKENLADISFEKQTHKYDDLVKSRFLAIFMTITS